MKKYRAREEEDDYNNISSLSVSPNDISRISKMPLYSNNSFIANEKIEIDQSNFCNDNDDFLKNLWF